VRALVSLIEDDQAATAWRWSCMRNSLESIVPRLNASWMKRTQTCPYSKALRGDTSVKLMVD